MIIKINKDLLNYLPKELNLLNDDIWLVPELTGIYSLWCREDKKFIKQYEILDEPLGEIINSFFFMLHKIDIIDFTKGEALELEVIK